MSADGAIRLHAQFLSHYPGSAAMILVSFYSGYSCRSASLYYAGKRACHCSPSRVPSRRLFVSPAGYQGDETSWRSHGHNLRHQWKQSAREDLEVAGFRVSEGGAGKLTVKFAVINHSDADIGDLTMKVKLTTTAAKPEDPPIAEFEAKVSGLGPQESKTPSAPRPPSCACMNCRIGNS